MEKIINFRPLAAGIKTADGRQIRENTMLRSGIVSAATPSDIEALQRMGLKYIYDFRSPYEVQDMPPLAADLFTTKHYDIVPQAAPRNYAKLNGTDGDTVRKIMTERYANLFGVTDKYKPVVKNILAQETPAFLFHCSAGKDRTGIFGAILMMALGFDADAVRAEYLIINQAEVDIMKRALLKTAGKVDDQGHLDSLFTVLPEYIDAYLGALIDAFDSIDAYLEKACGITADVKEKLREKYLI